MHSSIVRALLWGYWANIVYIIGMIGYLTIDVISYAYLSLNTKISSIIYVVLAIVFIIDAVLYTIDWYMYAVKLRTDKSQPIKYRSELFACIFQNLGSIFYFIGAALAFAKTRMIETRLLFSLMGIFTLLIESILTITGWFILCRRNTSKTLKDSCKIQVETMNYFYFTLLYFNLTFRIFTCGHIY